MSAARKTAKPDTARLRNGLESGTGLETKRADETKKGAPKYRRRIDFADAVRSFRAPRALIIAAACVGALLVAALLVAEPWARPETDDYTPPTGYESLPAATIAVGQTWGFGLEVSENERISDIIVNDPDILEADDGAVRALGEYYKTSVTFAVREASLPQTLYAHTIKLGSMDLSDEYDSLRTFLRAMFGIEKPTPERTELRTLRLCEQQITVNGLDDAASTATTIELDSGDDELIELVVTAGEGYEAYSTNDGVAFISEYGAVPGEFTIEAGAAGEASIVATVGFWKAVSAETYAEYLASSPALPAIAGVDAAETAAAHPNEIFVRTDVTVYPVSVAE